MTGLSLVLSKRQGLQSQRDQKVIPEETSVYKVPSQGRAACLANDKQFASRAGHKTAAGLSTTRDALHPTKTGAAGNKGDFSPTLLIYWGLFVCFWCVETGSFYVVQAGLHLQMFISQQPDFWDYRCEPSHLAQSFDF